MPQPQTSRHDVERARRARITQEAETASAEREADPAPLPVTSNGDNVRA
jgi:hypothetical protein